MEKGERGLLGERFRQFQSLYEQGKSLQEIAQVLEIDTNTLRSFGQSQPWAATRPHRGREEVSSVRRVIWFALIRPEKRTHDQTQE